MKNLSRIFLNCLAIIMLVSCDREETIVEEFGGVCEYKTNINSPKGFEIKNIGKIDFKGSVQSFHFVNEHTGYAMLGNNVGGYVEIFKTTNGGKNWTNLIIGIDRFPRGMVFKDENIGIITVQDITGCPPPNCQNKCVILKTTNAGRSWVKKEIENLKGILYHPQFDKEGNLYALLTLDNQSTLVKSTDNGETWKTFFSSSELGFQLVTFSFKIFEENLYISGNNGRIIVVDKNADLIKSLEIENSPIWDLEIIDKNNLIVVVSGKVIKSRDFGENWTTIYNGSARIVGFDSPEKGLMLLQKSSCPTDVYQSNDLIGLTNDGGLNWIEAKETTSNLLINYKNSQKLGNNKCFLMIQNELLEIKEK